jgi:hypothetical protein
MKPCYGPKMLPAQVPIIDNPSQPAAPSALPASLVLLQWLIRLGGKKEARNPPASARRYSRRAPIAHEAGRQVRAARAACELCMCCCCCCCIARPNLTFCLTDPIAGSLALFDFFCCSRCSARCCRLWAISPHGLAHGSDEQARARCLRALSMLLQQGMLTFWFAG